MHGAPVNASLSKGDAADERSWSHASANRAEASASRAEVPNCCELSTPSRGQAPNCCGLSTASRGEDAASRREGTASPAERPPFLRKPSARRRTDPLGRRCVLRWGRSASSGFRDFPSPFGSARPVRRLRLP